MYFPDEAQYLREEMLSAVNDSVNVDLAKSKMIGVGAEIRRRHAGSLRQAADASLWAILQSQIQMISAFEDDPVLCNRVVMYGVAAVPEAQQKSLVALMDSASLLYRGMYEGESNPIRRGAVTDDDWINLIEVFYEEGGTEAELDLVFEPNIQDPVLCTAMLRFLRASLYADFLGADRVRAEMVASMNES